MTLVAQVLNLFPDMALYDQWEVLVKRNTASGFMQSMPWARFKQGQGYKPLHIGIFDRSELIGGALCYLPPNGKSVAFISAPDGPVFDWANVEQSGRAMSVLVAELQQLSREIGFMGFHAEPRLALPVMRPFRNFARAPFDLIPNETLFLDLSQSEEQLLAEMKPKGRYNIRLAARHGVDVKIENTNDGLDTFYRLLSDAGLRDDFFVEPYDFFAAMFESLLAAGLLKVLVASHEGEALASMFYLEYGDRATYFYGGVSNEKRNVMAGYALQWEAIRLAKRNEKAFYDFYGYTELDDPEHPFCNFSKFKRQFGGFAHKYMGAHQHLFVSRLADAVIIAAQELEREELRV